MNARQHLRWWLTPTYARPETLHNTWWVDVVKYRYAEARILARFIEHDPEGGGE